MSERIQTDNLIHIENPTSASIQGNSLRLAEVYQPCEGTWTEFKGDVRRFFMNIKSASNDRMDDIRESAKGKFRRKR